MQGEHLYAMGGGGNGITSRPVSQRGPCWGVCVGAGSAEPMVREEAGPPSALLGSVPAFGTKAGAFPRPSAGAWKAAGCQHLLCGDAVMQARGPSCCSGLLLAELVVWFQGASTGP